MSQLDTVSYPVFLVDTDHYITLLRSSDDIDYHLELIDVENSEYGGWDNEGRPIELGIENDSVMRIRLKSETGDPAVIREAILHSASLGGRGREFRASREDLSLPQLLDEVDKFIDEGRLSRRIRRFFSRRKDK